MTLFVGHGQRVPELWPFFEILIHACISLFSCDKAGIGCILVTIRDSSILKAVLILAVQRRQNSIYHCLFMQHNSTVQHLLALLFSYLVPVLHCPTIDIHHVLHSSYFIHVWIEFKNKCLTEDFLNIKVIE